MAQAELVIRNGVAVMDPNNSTNAIPNTLKVNADGSINVEATGATFSAGAVATAAAPAYVEGSTDALSQTLAGNLRTISASGSTTAVTQATAANLNATIVGAGSAGTANAGVVTIQGIASMTPILATITPTTSTTFTPTQVTVPATTNGILILAANANRKGATISNPSGLAVYTGSSATGLTISNGFAIPAGTAYNIDKPLYTGAIYGIIATGTQVVTVVELT